MKRMNWTKTLKTVVALCTAAIGLMASNNAQAQTVSVDTTQAGTVTLSISMDNLTKLVQDAANILLQNSEGVKSTMAAAADSTKKIGSDALREIMNISSATAIQLLSELNNVADSVATASKSTADVARKVAEAKAMQAGQMITQGAQALSDMATKMTKEQTDSLKQTLLETRDALDQAIQQLDNSAGSTSKGKRSTKKQK